MIANVFVDIIGYPTTKKIVVSTGDRWVFFEVVQKILASGSLYFSMVLISFVQ